jgi:hypothetical protein
MWLAAARCSRVAVVTVALVEAQEWPHESQWVMRHEVQWLLP